MDHDINSVLVIGDSLSKGVVYNDLKQRYFFSKSCFANIIQSLLRIRIFNSSKFGTTIDYGQEVFKTKFPELNPDVVFLEFGGNDCDFDWDTIAKNPDFDHRPKTELPAFEKIMRSIVETIKSVEKIPLLINLPPLNAPSYFQWFTGGDAEKGRQILKWLGDVGKIYWWHERYSAAIERIARDTNTSLIDIRGEFLQHEDFRDYICIDGIHPNEKGHQLIAQTILHFAEQNADYLLLPNGV